MSIGWREVLGLLVGVAICYGVLSYALTNAPQYREAASEQTQKDSERGETGQRTDPEETDEETKTVTIRVTGSKGQTFGANYGNLRSSRSVESVVPADYEANVRTDRSSGDYISVTVWKTTGDDTQELKVQILDNGRVVREASTTEDYGATGVRYNPNDPELPAATTPEKEKKTGKDSAPKQGEVPKQGGVPQQGVAPQQGVSQQGVPQQGGGVPQQGVPQQGVPRP